jgi:transposase InsO family protein
MARDGEAVDPEFAAAVATYAQGTRFDVTVRCRELGVTRCKFYKYLHRFQTEGVEGFFPRTRRPLSSPQRLPAAWEDVLVEVRKREQDAGWDYGADAVLQHLADHPELCPDDRPLPARSTVNRVLADRGLLDRAPQRAPRRRPRRFQRDHANALWQYDGFGWQLADGSKVVVLHLNDDCSRLDLALEVATSENSLEVWAAFCVATGRYGLPAAVLTDNGTAFSGRRRGWTVDFETNLAELGIRSITSRVNHPQTCGKNERAHQRVLKWLRRQPLAADPARLQAQLEAYRTAYNTRPNRVLDGLTPQQRYQLGPLAGPEGRIKMPLHVTHGPVSDSGSIGVDGTRIGLGRRYAGATATTMRSGDLVTVFINDKFVRTLIIDRTRRYQPNPD